MRIEGGDKAAERAARYEHGEPGPSAIVTRIMKALVPLRRGPIPRAMAHSSEGPGGANMPLWSGDRRVLTSRAA